MNTSRLLFGLVAVGAAGLALYYATKKTVASATGNASINALPGRSYSQNLGSNPQSQPPSPTFTPFSGVPFIESALQSFGAAAPPNYDFLPGSNDSNNGSLSDAVNSGFSTTDLFGNYNYGGGDSGFSELV